MYRNWASRSGCCLPSRTLALPCKLTPIQMRKQGLELRSQRRLDPFRYRHSTSSCPDSRTNELFPDDPLVGEDRGVALAAIGAERAEQRTDQPPGDSSGSLVELGPGGRRGLHVVVAVVAGQDRKSTRLNSSHTVISYAVFCLKKKKI